MASINEKIDLPIPVQGIRADVDDFHVPPDALRDTSYNWLYRNGQIVTRPGITPLGQDVGSEVPLRLVSFFTNLGASHQVFATDQRWWRYDDTTSQFVDISDPALLLTGNASIPPNFRVFNSAGISYLLGVNGVNTPRAWSTNPPATNPFTEFGGNPPIARCIAIVADRVLLGHHVTGVIGPTGVDVSAFQDHTQGWGTTQTANLVEAPGFIVEMRELSTNRTAIYKTDGIYIASGTTGLAPIRFDLQQSEISGPINSATVVSLQQGTHAVFARDHHLYLYDGLSYTRHPSSDRIRILYEKDVTDDIFGGLRTHAHYNRTHNELWWFYTRTGLEAFGPRDAIVLNMTNGSVWKINYTNAAFSFTASEYGRLNQNITTQRNTTFLGNSNGRIYLHEGSLDDTLELDVLMESGLSGLGNPTRTKTLQETNHYFSSPATTQTPSVSILTSGSGENATVSSAKVLSVGEGEAQPYAVGHRVSSRFFGIRIEDQGLSDPLEYRGTTATISLRGER